MNVGIIGCGYVCDTYMGTWDRHPRLKILGVADIDQARAEKISKLYNLRRYASNEEMLADPAVEIVVNLTSITSHNAVTRAALEAGLDRALAPAAARLTAARRSLAAPRPPDAMMVDVDDSPRLDPDPAAPPPPGTATPV